MTLNTFSMFDKVYDVWMLNHAKCFNLSLNELFEVLVLVQDFHCILVSCIVLGDLDLAAGTCTECPSNAEVVDGS